MNTLDLLKIGSNKLRKNKVLSSLLDSEILLSKALNKTREEMLSNTESKIGLDQIRQYKKFILRRSQNEPVAYILNKKEFWSRDFYGRPCSQWHSGLTGAASGPRLPPALVTLEGPWGRRRQCS